MSATKQMPSIIPTRSQFLPSERRAERNQGRGRSPVVIRTLVVDDSASFLAAAAEVVSAADGFELAGTAQSGEEAVELVRSIRPDFALIDFNMPGMSGEETAERLASESPETVTVVVTATPDATGRLNGRFDKRGLSPATLKTLWERAQDRDVPL